MQASPLGSHSDGQPGGAIDFSLSKTQFNRLIQANPVCVDCGAKDPDWASISLAVMMCIECSGIHRSMGVHVSKVSRERVTAFLCFLVATCLGGIDRPTGGLMFASCYTCILVGEISAFLS